MTVIVLINKELVTMNICKLKLERIASPNLFLYLMLLSGIAPLLCLNYKHI